MQNKQNNVICLEATRERDRMKIGIHKLDEPIRPYKDIPVSSEKIETRCKEMTDLLNSASRKGGKDPNVPERLRGMGRMLADELLPPDIKDKLCQSDADYLLLNIDDHLVHIPWELICAGEAFLCEQFRVGRMVRTRQDTADSGEREMSAPLKMWILANPGNDLPRASLEGLSICEDMDRMNQEREEPLIVAEIDSGITSDDIKERLKSYDFVHFAGHADFVPHEPGQSGWRVGDGNFRADDIYKMRGRPAMPALVFSNACQSARTEEWKHTDDVKTGSFGLANAFMLAGVKHYIGTCWDIMDEPSSKFAHNFYEHLLSGNTVGEAVQRARFDLIQEGDELCWTSYLLYGDPRHRYFGEIEESEDDLPSKAEKDFDSGYEIEESDSLAPGHHIRTAEVIDSGVDLKNETSEPDDKKKTLLSKLKKWMILCLVIAITVGGIIFFYQHREPEIDKWTSEIITLAVVGDYQGNAFDGNIRHIIGRTESIMDDDYKRIQLVARDPMIKKLIMEELELWESKYMDPEHTPKAGLWGAKFILHLRVNQADSQPSVTMHLVNVARGTTQKVLIEDMESFTLGSGRKERERLAETIVKKLKEIYPLRGKIISVTDGKVILNIGEDIGVQVGQHFRVIDKDMILKIESVKADGTSTAAVIKGNGVLKRGWKVKIMHNQQI